MLAHVLGERAHERAAEAASPAENSAPACCEPTWFCRLVASGQRTTPPPVSDLDHLEPEVTGCTGSPARSPRDRFVVHLAAPPSDCAAGCANRDDPARRRPLPVERATVRDGLELAYVREGAGGFPLLLLHGWPETKRIWWRNIEPLAAAGFEVIVPDLRGFGDSGLAPDGFYDPAAQARDVHALVHDVLGHERCAAAGGDVGGVVIQDLGLRFEGFVVRQCLFNTVLPLLPDDYERAGHPAARSRARRARPPTTSCARGARRTSSPPSSTRPSAPPLHRAVLRLAVLGRRRARSPRTTSTS